MKERHFFSLAVVFFVLIGIMPLLWMFVHSFWVDGVFSLHAYRGIFEGRLLHALGRSVLLSLVVAMMSVLVGVVLGVLFAKTDIAGGRLWVSMVTLPLLIPPYILAFSWYGVLGHSAWLFGFWGCVWVLFTVYLPIPLLFSLFFLGQMDARLEEAARLVGGWRAVLLVDMGTLFPVILSSFLLVFILVFGSYGVPNFLRYDVFSTVSFTQFAAFYDFKAATASSMPLLGIVLLLWVFVYLQKKSPKITFDKQENIQKIALKEKRWWIQALVWGFVGLIMIVPFGLLFWQVGSIDNFFIALEKGWSALLHTLFYAFFSASVMTVLGLLLAYVLVYRIFAWAGFVEMGALALFALPSTLFGISLILFYNHAWSDFIYATPMIVVLAIVGKYLILTMKISEAKLGQISPSLLESATLLGASWQKRWWYIVLPMMKEALLFAWLVGFVFALRESTLSMLLYPAGWESLPTYIFTQMANGNPAIIAALSLIMIGLMAGFLGILVKLLRSLS